MGNGAVEGRGCSPLLNRPKWVAVRERHRSRHSREDRVMLVSIKKFLKSEDGPTAVEYAVMLALIVIVCLTAVKAVGTNANATFDAIGDDLSTANGLGGSL